MRQWHAEGFFSLQQQQQFFAPTTVLIWMTSAFTAAVVPQEGSSHWLQGQGYDMPTGKGLPQADLVGICVKLSGEKRFIS